MATSKPCKLEIKQNIKRSVDNYLAQNNDASFKDFIAAHPSIKRKRYAKNIFEVSKALRKGNAISDEMGQTLGLKWLINYMNQDEGLTRLKNIARNMGIPLEKMEFYITKTLGKQRAVRRHEKVMEFYNGDPTGRTVRKGSFVWRIKKELGLDVKDASLYWEAKGAIERHYRGQEIFNRKINNEYAYYYNQLLEAQKRGDASEVAKLRNKLDKITEKSKYPPLLKGGMAIDQATKDEYIQRKVDNAPDDKEQYIRDLYNGRTKDKSKKILVAEDILNDPKYKGKEQQLRDFYLEFKENVIDPGVDALHEGYIISEEQALMLKAGDSGHKTKFNWYLPALVNKTFVEQEALQSTSKNPASGPKSLTGGEGFIRGEKYDPLSTALVHHEAYQEMAMRNLAKVQLAQFFVDTIKDPAVVVKGVRAVGRISPDGSYISSDIDQDGPNKIRYYENGKRKEIVLPPIEGFEDSHPIKTAFSFPEQLGDVAKVASKINSWYRMMYTTRQVTFPVVNFIRDFAVGMINLSTVAEETGIPKSTLRWGYTKTMGKLLLGTVDQSTKEKYQRYSQEAGDLGMYINFSDYTKLTERAEAYQKRYGSVYMDNLLNRKEGNLKGKAQDLSKRAIRDAANALDAWADMFENANRLAIYGALRDAGVPANVAAFHGRETTLNFERKGLKIGNYSAWYIFLNAGLQDINRSWDVLFGQDARTITTAEATIFGRKIKSKKVKMPSGRGMQIMATTAFMGFSTRLISLMYADLMGDDEEDQAIKEAILRDDYKTSNYIILPGFSEGAHLTIPKPYTIFRAPWALGEYVAESIYKGAKLSPSKGIGVFAGTFLNSIDPIGASEDPISAAPFLLRPALAAWMNRNWLGKDIINKYVAEDKSTDIYEKYYASTSEYAKVLSKGADALGLPQRNDSHFYTPVVIDYMLDQYIFTGAIDSYDRLLFNIAEVFSGQELKKETDKGVGDFKNLLDYSLYKAANKEPKKEAASEFKWKNTPVVRRFYADIKEQPYKLKGLLQSLTSTVRPEEFTKKDYYFVVDALSKVDWSERQKSRYKTDFQRTYDKQIKELGLEPLKILDEDGKVIRQKKGLFF